jgi:hypothetical protein
MGDDLPGQQFNHCVAVYARMHETSFEERPIIDGQVSDEAELIRVWEGYTTQLFNELQLPAPYYSSVRRHLIRMGCIEQLRRGGGNTTSRWMLLREPTEELFDNSPSTASSARSRLEATQQQNRDLGQRVTHLEHVVNTLVARMADLLEGKYDQHTNQDQRQQTVH